MDDKIRLVGDIHYESNLVDGRGIRIASDFMRQLVREFSKQSSSYIRVTGEVPFVFKERQSHSCLAPEFSRFTDAFLMESPVNRKWSSISSDVRDDSHGWVDYWCYYRSIGFLIELKHGFISNKTGHIRKSVKDEWEIASKQLDAIEKEAKLQSEWTNGAFRVALEILPFYDASNIKKENNMRDNEIMLSTQINCLNQFTPRPNWTALWILDKILVEPHEYLNSIEFYPGVLFISRISKISK